MYSSLFPYLLLAWDYRFGIKYLSYRRAVRKTEQMGSKELRELQWRLLKQLIDHAYRNVPYYRTRFDEAGVVPSELAGPGDLNRIPILTRNDLRDNLPELVASDVDRSGLTLVHTGGSTGQPVRCYRSVDFSAHQKAIKARAEAWAGYQDGDKRAVVWGADRDLPLQSPSQRFRSRYVLREQWLNAYNLTEHKMGQFARVLIDWKPKVIVGYARALHLFAQFLRANHLDMIRPVSVATSAETLFDYQRKTIEDVFQCGVFDFYGSRDVPCIAGECNAHEGLHVFADNVYVEVLRDGQQAVPGEVGEIIVTTLTNYAMPLIRYQNGDLARGADHECSCGLPYPLLSEIVGRSNDVLTTPNGQIVHGAFFNHLLFEFEEIEEFQVRQKTLERVMILLKCRKELSDETIKSLQLRVMDHMGPGVQVSLEMVDAIPLTATGKHRYMISEVPPSFLVSGRSTVSSNRERESG